MSANGAGTLTDVQRRDGRPSPMIVKPDLTKVWQRCLAMAANKGQSFRVAAGMFRSQARQLLNGSIEESGVGPLPKSHEWNRPVAEVFPQYARRKQVA
jgi:hypothetical protein